MRNMIGVVGGLVVFLGGVATLIAGYDIGLLIGPLGFLVGQVLLSGVSVGSFGGGV